VTNKIGSENVGARGRGRPKGAQNKTTKALKEMILEALENKGGVDYLEKQADDNPNAFLTLVGKVLPLDVNAKAEVTLRTVARRILNDR